MAEYVIMPKADYEAACNSIRAKTGKTDLIKSGSLSTEIDSITGGGGSSADVRYVTFTNASTGETFVKPVAVGDDCVDVVAKGLWATPTQESTAQYDYTFSNSWSAEPNGEADPDILKNITEDKTVYAVFTATLRKYTITWLDSDGVTELPGQKQWAYGTIPSYTPSKDGAIFGGWTPTPVEVTGDATYTASWVSVITIIPSQTITTVSSSKDSPVVSVEKTSGYNIEIDRTYVVKWDGQTYSLNGLHAKNCFGDSGATQVYTIGVGNPHVFTKRSGETLKNFNGSNWVYKGTTSTRLPNTGEPFWIAQASSSGADIYGSTFSVYTETPGTHTLAIEMMP